MKVSKVIFAAILAFAFVAAAEASKGEKGVKKIIELPNPDSDKIKKIMVIKSNSTKVGHGNDEKKIEKKDGKVVLEKEGAVIELVRATRPPHNGTEKGERRSKVKSEKGKKGKSDDDAEDDSKISSTGSE